MRLECCKNKESLAQLTQVTKFLNIIAEENRLRILCFLRRGDQCVCDIWKYLHLSQPTASHHLKILKDFGLVVSKRQGVQIFYHLNTNFINQYFSYLRNFIDF